MLFKKKSKNKNQLDRQLQKTKINVCGRGKDVLHYKIWHFNQPTSTMEVEVTIQVILKGKNNSS